jgi:hypothetical protein
MLFKSRFSLLWGESRPSGRVESGLLSKGCRGCFIQCQTVHTLRQMDPRKRYTNVCSQPKIFVSVPCNEPNLAGMKRRSEAALAIALFSFRQTLRLAMDWMDLLKQARASVFCSRNVQRLYQVHMYISPQVLYSSNSGRIYQ